MRRPRNSATATSLAALRTVGAAAAGLQRLAAPAPMPGSERDRDPQRSGRGRAQDRAAPPAVDPPRPSQTMRDRDAHVGGAELRDDRTVPEYRRAHAPPIADGPTRRSLPAECEQVVGLDHLEAFVHQARGIDGDLRPHRPVRMVERLFRRRRVDSSSDHVRNGPPDAVRMIRLTSSRGPAPSA